MDIVGVADILVLQVGVIEQITPGGFVNICHIFLRKNKSTGECRRKVADLQFHTLLPNAAKMSEMLLAICHVSKYVSKYVLTL